MKEWIFKAKIVIETEVIVPGRNEDNALANFDKKEWSYVDFNQGSITDWTAIGKPQENK